MTKYIVIYSSGGTLETLGPGELFDTREEAEKAIVEDAEWMGDAYDCAAPETIKDVYSIIIRWGLDVDFHIERLEI